MTAPIKPPVVSLHQHMTDGYEAQVELSRRAGFSDDMMITSGDLMEQALSEITVGEKWLPKSGVWAGFYRHGSVK